MTFIPKSPISSPEVENVNNKPPKGTRAIFAKSDGWYMIDSDGNELKIATTSDINNSNETFIISANYTGEFSGFFAFDLSMDKSYDKMVDAYISGKTLLFKLTNNDKVFYLGLSEVLKGHALDENGENYTFDFRSGDISNSVVCDIICVKIDKHGAVLEFTESTTFIDTMPEKDSQHLITSGGVYESIEEHNTSEDAHGDIRTKLKNCFSFEDGYEDEIDSYTGDAFGIWYKINHPRDDFYLYWDYYYLFAIERNNGHLLQVKIFENEQGIYFRTGKRKGTDVPSFGGGDLTAVHEWNEWTRTLLSNEIDDTPTKDSNKLITSGGVYNALQNIPSGGGGEAATQPHYIFDAYLTITDGRLRVDSFESVENITEAFNSGRMVIAQTQMQYLDADENLITVDVTCLIATSPYTFFGVTSKSDHVFIENSGEFWVGGVNEAMSKKYVDAAIGNIETSLENIIAKYGLGGEV